MSAFFAYVAVSSPRKPGVSMTFTAFVVEQVLLVVRAALRVEIAESDFVARRSRPQAISSANVVCDAALLID
ncbi:MAG: hypothetical protein ACLU0O_12290 [Collinsella sp.]